MLGSVCSDFRNQCKKPPNLITLPPCTSGLNAHFPPFCFAYGGRERERERGGEGEAYYILQICNLLFGFLLLLASSFTNINGGVKWDLWGADAELSIRFWWKLRTISEPHHCLNYQRERERWARDIWEATIHIMPLPNTVKCYVWLYFTLCLLICMPRPLPSDFCTLWCHHPCNL